MWLKVGEHDYINLAVAERIGFSDDGTRVGISFPSGPGQQLRGPELVEAVKEYLSRAQVVAGGNKTPSRG